MIGEGRYDKAAAVVMAAEQADAVVVIVLEGRCGSGISCKTKSDPPALDELPKLLRAVADAFERDRDTMRRSN